MVQISEENVDRIREKCQKILRLGGQIMDCIENVDDAEERKGAHNERYLD